MTGASVTNKGLSIARSFQSKLALNPNLGIYYEQGKEPPLEGPPKLHLLIESNEEFRVRNFLLLSFLPCLPSEHF
jgi:ATP-dependent RNA helicase DDX46/PRP5